MAEQNHKNWKTTTLDKNLVIECLPPPSPPPPAILMEIETLWEKGKKNLPTLYNGYIFCVDHLSAHHITGHWDQFSHLYAQMKNPKLQKGLHLQSLAVIGLILTPEGIVLAKRSQHAFYKPNSWQSPPAGSVECRESSPPLTRSISLSENLLAEAEEELGLPQDTLVVGPALVAVTHPNASVIDIGIILTTSLSFSQIFHCWKKCQNTEYSELALVEFERLASSTWQTHFPELIPTTDILIKTWQKTTHHFLNQ
ncbi:NUDIX hydrolase [Entomobacter blattae]|uniref:Nudix hydrolase domain-containing protein n=1 Tax=Entomobacter blattae TaxID=2762277 RepID=A0A7H1NSC1_9PROT|nr:NUDIX hydrolase [Entomobacter blattae]QNT78681.1 hypothetical protein JGUZn3_14570 [Entomobacter blattae]